MRDPFRSGLAGRLESRGADAGISRTQAEHWPAVPAWRVGVSDVTQSPIDDSSPRHSRAATECSDSTEASPCDDLGMDDTQPDLPTERSPETPRSITPTVTFRAAAGNRRVESGLASTDLD